MASLFKPTITTYHLPDGKHRTADRKRVTKETPGAVKDSHVSEIWYGKFTDASGASRRVRLCANKEAAKTMLAKLVTDAALGKVGALDTFEPHNNRPIAEHLTDFEDHLRTGTNKRGGKNTEKHVKITIDRSRAIIAGCKFRRICDISGGQVQRFLHELGKQDYGAQTRNGYLQAIGQFCRWLVFEDRLARNPLAKLRKENVDLDQRHARRPFTMEELPWIFAVTAASKWEFRGFGGADRVALYATALGTGFRVKELASLTPLSFDLERALVNVEGKFTKDRRPVINRPIPQGLADHLRVYLEGKHPDRAIWPGTWVDRASRMVKADLAAARAAWIKDAGDDVAERDRRTAAQFLVYRNAKNEYADCHAWRHTFVTLLVASGVNSKMAMELARHSSLELTLGRYAHVEQAAVVEAVNRMPQFLAATGTDGRAVDRALTRQAGLVDTRLKHTETIRGEGRHGDGLMAGLTLRLVGTPGSTEERHGTTAEMDAENGLNAFPNRKPWTGDT